MWKCPKCGHSFKNENQGHYCGKAASGGLQIQQGSIQIPYSDDLPLDLIAEIADWCRKTGNHA